MALSDVIDQYVTAFGAMTGLVRCYADPPEAMTEFPCAIVYASSGEMAVGGHGAQSIHMINLEIHHSRQILPEAVDAAKVWPDRVLSALYNGGTFGGYVAAVVWPVTYDALALGYNTETHYGMRFRIPTKVITTP
jgi:hypothetical protein